MFLFRRPSRFLSSREHGTLSYAEVGATRGSAPSGCTVDRSRVQRGQGVAAFELAIEAIRLWKMFHMAWLSLCWPDPDRGGCYGGSLDVTLWVLVVKRMDVVNERGSSRRHGWGYGTWQNTLK